MATLQTYHEVVCDAEPPAMRGTSVNARSVREYLGRGHCNHYKTTNGMDLIPTSPALGRAKRLSRSAVCAVAHVALTQRSGDGLRRDPSNLGDRILCAGPRLGNSETRRRLNNQHGSPMSISDIDQDVARHDPLKLHFVRLFRHHSPWSAHHLHI